jgi:signal peptidase I
MTDYQLTTKEPQLYHRKWVGILCGSLFPGSAHFLAGQKMWGIFWFCGYLSLVFSRWFMTSIPGKLFDILTPFLFFAPILYIILLLVFSWRPIRRLGYRGWILFILIVLIFGQVLPFATFHFNQNVADFNHTPTSTMTPTICPSATSSWLGGADVFVSNAWIYWWDDPKRGDIVCFCHYDENGKAESKLWSKRVVGLPRETIDIDPPFVIVNGKPLIEPDIFRKISEAQDGYLGYFRLPYNAPNSVQFPLTLADDEYFLLGDNSIKSIDSRTFGAVKRRDIKSKVIRIVFPPSRIKEL